MHVVSDDERRDIAQRLRELCDYCDENEMSLSDDDWPGVLSDYIWPEDSGYHTYDDDCRRLADLIEPSCDREALLDMEDEMFESATGIALISELEEDADLKDLQTTMAKVLFGYARRIREACGEVVR